MTAEAPLFRLWAKSNPFHPLPCHMIDAGSVALELLRAESYRGLADRILRATSCTREQLSTWIPYVVALHDIGKCHHAFQAKQPELTEPLVRAGLPFPSGIKGFRHEAVSAGWIQEHLKRAGWKPESAFTTALALRGHHGDFRAEAPVEHQTAEAWVPLREALAGTVRTVFSPTPWSAGFQNESAAGVLLSGIVVLSDWIASNRDLFRIKWSGEDLTIYAQRSLDTARRALDKLGFTRTAPWHTGMSFRQVWPRVETPRGVQEACEEIVKASEPAGLTIIEAPMGEGKSEAALYLATQWLATHGLAGLYVALPTAATANQMFTRVQELMAQHDPDAAEGVRLVHGMSWLIDELSPEEPPEVDEGAESEEAAERALDWFRPTKRSLLAPDGVGTVDQALKGALHVRFGFLRLLGLTGKVLIIDEVHAYDPYMSEILVRLLQWCRSLEIPVILLSATLPADRRISLIRAYDPEAALPQHRHGGYPLITLVYPGTRVEEVPVSRVHQHANVTLHLHRGLLGESERVAHLAADQALAGGCVAVIANTVNSAQAIYRALKRLDLPPDLILRLFHARFPAGRRQEIEAEVLTYFDKRSLLPLEDPNWKERPKRAILVATQVVEQSLDLDFDTMITELAPIDLLLQRTGRLHRHRRPGRDGQPVLHVLLPHEGADGFGATVYEPYFLMRTLQVLEKDQVWQLPALIRQLVEDVYAPPADGPSDVTLGQAYQAYLAGRKTDVQMADSFLLKAPSTRAFDAWLRTLAPQEDDEAVSSYLHAKTRKGDDSVRLLVVGDEPWQTVLGQRRSPGRDLLREIYLHTLNAPDWWFKWVTPATGYEPVGDAPLWLPGTKVLRLKAGEWHGSDRKGHPVVIRLSDEYGLYRLQGEGEHAHL